MRLCAPVCVHVRSYRRWCAVVCRWWVHPLFTLLSAASLFSLWAVGASLFSLGWVLASFSLAGCALGVYGVYGGVCRWCAAGYRSSIVLVSF